MMLEKDTLRPIILTSQDSSGQPIRYPNDLHIGIDGMIYFSDSSAIAPALNAQGFYDTLWAYILTQLQVNWGRGSRPCVFSSVQNQPIYIDWRKQNIVWASSIQSRNNSI